MVTRRMFGLGLSAAFLPTPAFSAADSSGEAARKEISKRLVGRRAPGGFVAVSRGGNLEAFFPWGEASKSFSQPVTNRTLFHLGSASKQVTAMAILRLQMEGKIDPDQAIGAYLKDLPQAWAEIAVRHLLSHTSGLPDYLSVLSDWDRPQPRATVIKALADVPLNFSPGDAWAYTNTGYLLLGWLIDNVSRQGYAGYIRSVLEAAGAPTARLDAAGEIITDRAEPYTLQDDTLVHARRMDSSVSAAADGGVLMSALDVGPWRAAMSRGSLVPATILQDALRAAPLSTGRQAPYNYGFVLDRTRSKALHRHGGGVPGFVSYWAALPEQSLSALAVSNYDGPNAPDLGEMAHTALEAMAPESTFLSLPSQTADSRSRALRTLLERGQKPPDPGLLAPELARLGPGTRGVPRLSDPIISLLPNERYEANGGEMVRYKITQAEGSFHLLAGWTSEERLFWLG